jgi:hypothetical protein
MQIISQSNQNNVNINLNRAIFFFLRKSNRFDLQLLHDSFMTEPTMNWIPPPHFECWQHQRTHIQVPFKQIQFFFIGSSGSMLRSHCICEATHIPLNMNSNPLWYSEPSNLHNCCKNRLIKQCFKWMQTKL